jgi:GT2 family glycosyltransferase
MSSRPSVAAIVLGFDRREKTRACVESLLRSTPSPPHILLVDNGSRDGTAEAIAAEFPAVRVERSPVNLGAAAGRNLGVRCAIEAWDPDLLLFVDDDAEVHPRAIHALASVFADPDRRRVGATAAKIHYPGTPPTIYVAGGSRIRFWSGDTRPTGQGEIDDGQYDQREACIPGAGCTMVRRAAFVEIGGFDEEYDPYGYEDLDLSLRLVEDGWRILYVPEALARHERGASFEGGRYTARYAGVKRRNWLRFLSRHASVPERILFWTIGGPALLARAVLREIGRGNLAAVGGLLGLREQE